MRPCCTLIVMSALNSVRSLNHQGAFTSSLGEKKQPTKLANLYLKLSLYSGRDTMKNMKLKNIINIPKRFAVRVA